MKLPKIKTWNKGFLKGTDIIDVLFLAWFTIVMIANLIVGDYTMATINGSYIIFIAMLLMTIESRNKYIKRFDILLDMYMATAIELDELKKKKRKTKVI